MGTLFKTVKTTYIGIPSGSRLYLRGWLSLSIQDLLSTSLRTFLSLIVTTAFHVGLNFGKGGNADTSSSVFNALSSFCLINLGRDEMCNNPEFHLRNEFNF